MSTVIGFDPSTRGTAYAVLAHGKRGFVFVDSGVIEGDLGLETLFVQRLTDLLTDFKPGAAYVETPERVPVTSNTVAVMSCAATAGLITGACAAAGVPVGMVQASGWRKALLGSTSPSDAQIKLWVRACVKDWPKVSNDHVRDAAATAVSGHYGKGLLGPGKNAQGNTTLKDLAQAAKKRLK